MTKLAQYGRKGFRAFCVVVLEVGNGNQAEIGGQVEKRTPYRKWSKSLPGINMAEKGPNILSRYLSHLLTTSLWIFEIIIIIEINDRLIETTILFQ